MTARVSWELPEILGGLRTGTTRSLGLAQLAGIVSMPSFHAAAAILLIHGYALLSWLRWPAVLVFGVMFFSAVPVGGHYLVDIIAGFLLALLSIRCAGRIFDRLSTPDKAGQAASARREWSRSAWRSDSVKGSIAFLIPPPAGSPRLAGRLRRGG